MRARRVLTVACVAALALIASGCGAHTMHTGDANNDGTYIGAGPLTYQLEVSRELNQYTSEDSGYIKGLPKGDSTLAPDELWYGVFLWAKNETNRTHVTTGNFDIVDTQGNIYHPLKLDPALNPYAWAPKSLAPGETQPNIDTTASFGPTGGELLLFKLNNSIYNNRPLTLQIRAPSGNKVWGTMSLDL